MKFKWLITIIILFIFIIGATPPPTKKPAQTGTYKTGKYKSSSAHGKGGCFITIIAEEE